MNLESLVICGQNLGALTALASAENDPRIKGMLICHPKIIKSSRKTS